MLRFEVHLEDSHFVAEGGNDGWKVNLWDSLSGKADRRIWSTKQLSAVLALACGLGEEMDSESPARPMAITYLYRLAEPALAGLDDGLRPCP